MNLSLGEFQAVAAKALRGGGYSWGMAAEGARACRSLAAMGIDPSPHLLRLLDVVDELGIDALRPRDTLSGERGRTCPISAGAAISDSPPPTPFSLIGVVEPVLLLPALRSIATTDTGLAMQWEGGAVVIGDSGVDRVEVPAEADIEIQPAPAPARSYLRSTRIDIAAAILEQLNRYAHRTYAPSTEASRAAGAGAGLTDND